jgi:hypothetical protein
VAASAQIGDSSGSLTGEAGGLSDATRQTTMKMLRATVLSCAVLALSACADPDEVPDDPAASEGAVSASKKEPAENFGVVLGAKKTREDASSVAIRASKVLGDSEDVPVKIYACDGWYRPVALARAPNWSSKRDALEIMRRAIDTKWTDAKDNTAYLVVLDRRDKNGGVAKVWCPDRTDL